MDNKQLKVLVIEDNSKISKDLKKELISEGYKVSVAISTEHGLLRAKAYQFDLFIVNCGDDGKKGLSFANSITKEVEYQKTPFLLTLNPTVEVDVRLRKLSHHFDLMRLPIDTTELNIRLSRLFSIQKTEESLNNGTINLSDIKVKAEKKNVKAESVPQKVLLVEDNPLNQKVLGMFISKLGFEFEVASNGQMAVDLSNANQFPFILMDIYMPGMDGTEATELIRKNELEGSHRAKIIAITANESSESVKRCYDSGMDDYLVKPFTIEVLKEKLV
jgi:DNA-binding response OmpR family regulator